MPRVLVVEDQPEIGRSLVLLLQHQKFDVEWVSDGESALTQFQARVPDVVLTDMALPGMSGSEVATRIRELHPTVKIIVMSGSGDVPGSEVAGNSARAAGIFARIEKPFGFAELIGLLRRALAA